MTDTHPHTHAPARTAADVDNHVAGIRVGLEMGGLDLDDVSEHAARAVLTGDVAADEAIAQGMEELRARGYTL